MPIYTVQDNISPAGCLDLSFEPFRSNRRSPRQTPSFCFTYEHDRSCDCAPVLPRRPCLGAGSKGGSGKARKTVLVRDKPFANRLLMVVGVLGLPGAAMFF